MNWRIVVPFLAALFAVDVSAARLMGGAEDADINDKGVQNALQFAVVRHNKNSNDLFVSQVSRVIKAQTQVVAGMKYIFTVEMGKTPCRKGGPETLCTIHEDPQLAAPFQCKFEVWSRPWLNDIQLVKNTCLPVGENF